MNQEDTKKAKAVFQPPLLDNAFDILINVYAQSP